MLLMRLVIHVSNVSDLVDNVKNSTSDNDIINRDWLLIDVDPKRATGVSASNSEKANSKETINRFMVSS